MKIEPILRKTLNHAKNFQSNNLTSYTLLLHIITYIIRTFAKSSNFNTKTSTPQPGADYTLLNAICNLEKRVIQLEKDGVNKIKDVKVHSVNTNFQNTSYKTKFIRHSKGCSDDGLQRPRATSPPKLCSKTNCECYKRLVLSYSKPDFK